MKEYKKEILEVLNEIVDTPLHYNMNGGDYCILCGEEERRGSFPGHKEDCTIKKARVLLEQLEEKED